MLYKVYSKNKSSPQWPITDTLCFLRCSHKSTQAMYTYTHTPYCLLASVVEVDAPWALFVQFCFNAGQCWEKFPNLCIFLSAWFTIRLGRPCLSRLPEHLSVFLSQCLAPSLCSSSLSGLFIYPHPSLFLVNVQNVSQPVFQGTHAHHWGQEEQRAKWSMFLKILETKKWKRK